LSIIFTKSLDREEQNNLGDFDEFAKYIARYLGNKEGEACRH